MSAYAQLSITVEDLLAREPCWEDDDILEVAQHLTVPATARTLLRELPQQGVSVENVLWVVLDESLLLSSTMREFACRCAERALTREREAGREPDPRSWEAVRVARAHAQGEATGEELASARDARDAMDAAMDAWAAAMDARDAAWAAARDAAWAALDAAESAAESAAWDATYTAKAASWAARAARDAWAARGAWDAWAARDAERQWQLDELERMVEEEVQR